MQVCYNMLVTKKEIIGMFLPVSYFGYVAIGQSVNLVAQTPLDKCDEW